jgi:serine phosphatase RsbU (regulator of sigma subunit)
MGNLPQALYWQKRTREVMDSVQSLESRSQTTEFDTELSLTYAENEVKEQQLVTNRLMLTAAIVIALIIIGFLSVIAIRRKKHMKHLQSVNQELQRAYDQLETTTKAKERIESELRIAREIQKRMLPHVFPKRRDVDIYAMMTPAKEVGGDLYGYVLIDDMLYFCVGDVSGKGMPASLFMAQATRLFQTLARQGMQPAEICTRINDALSGDDNENGMFVTLFVGLVDLETGHLWFCNAGHNPPVIGGTASHGDFLKMESNAPLGLWSGLEFVGEEVDSIKGRPLFIYTDGLNEAENRQQEQFGEQRLLSILRSMQFETSQQVIETLTDEVERHRNGAEPNDDLTMMCIRVIDLHRCLSRG